jgi:hypothetical protein
VIACRGDVLAAAPGAARATFVITDPWPLVLYGISRCILRLTAAVIVAPFE